MKYLIHSLQHPGTVLVLWTVFWKGRRWDRFVYLWEMGVGTGAQAAPWELELHLLEESLGKNGDRVTAFQGSDWVWSTPCNERWGWAVLTLQTHRKPALPATSLGTMCVGAGPWGTWRDDLHPSSLGGYLGTVPTVLYIRAWWHEARTGSPWLELPGKSKKSH